MDPHIRWLRRFVLTQVVERVLVEAALIGVAVGGLAVLDGSSRPEAALLAAIAAATTGVLRVTLAVGTNPINHRYLLRWTDPTTRIQVAARPTAGDDPELNGVPLQFLVRLERSDSADDDGGQPGPGVEVFRAERARLLLARSDDGELTALSRLADGRALVTSDGFLPPVETLVVHRAEPGRGQDPVARVVAAHLDHLLQLRRAGIEAVGIEPGAVVALLRTEWEAWQQLGPIVGPLVALGPRRALRLSLQVDVPPELVLDRTTRPRPGRTRRPAAATAPAATTPSTSRSTATSPTPVPPAVAGPRPPADGKATEPAADLLRG